MIGALALELAERGLVPLPLLRSGVRSLLDRRRRELERGGDAARRARAERLAVALAAAPVALATDLANAQHYELPAEFFGLVLGARRKYSGCLFPTPETTLDQAEEAMLALSVERAGVVDGMDLLDLGCGWGSLTLYLAERFPTSSILAVSNSTSQRRFIESECRRRGFGNVTVETADMNRFETGRRFDRALSIEMFEHMRNWPALLGRIAGWLEPSGRLFLHVFCHRSDPYLFEVGRGAGDWMARHFFTEGLMPTPELVRRFDAHLAVERQWEVAGTHYAATARAWRENLERRRSAAMPILRAAYGRDAERWYERWRLFFLACEELFASRGGTEWFVSHSLLAPVR